jgi:23S rRNA pseudouridine1911/1915/1917 synthase
MSAARSLPLPDGLDGLRLDVAVSRLFGVSRTAAATLVDDGAVLPPRAGVPAAAPH